MSKLILTLLFFSTLHVTVSGQKFYYNSEEFGLNDIVKDDYVVDVEEGENGRIYWVNRRQILINDRGTFTEIFDLSGYPRVKQILDDRKGKLWIILNQPLGEPLDETIIVLNTKDFTPIPLEKLWLGNLKILESSGIELMIRDKNGQIYIYTNDRNNYLLGLENLEPYERNIPLRDSVSLNLFPESNKVSTIESKDRVIEISSLGFGNSEEISIFQGSTKIVNRIPTKRINLSKIKSFGLQFKVHFHDHKTLILYKEKKISLLDLEKDTELKLDEEVPSLIINRNILNVQLYGDNIWVGTNKGLIKITKQQRDFTSFLSNNSASIRNIISYGEDSIVIAHENGISLYSPTNGSLQTRITDIAAYGLIKNGNNIIFTTFSNQLFISSIEKRNLWSDNKIETRKLEMGYIKNIYALGDDDILLLESQGITQYNYKSRELQRFKNEGCPIKDLRSIFELDGQIVVTGDGGVCNVNLSNMSYTKDDSYPFLKISHIYKSDDSIAWISTKGDGLLKKNLNNGQVDTFAIDDGLLNLNVHSAYQDSQDRLWMSTDFGISVLDVNTNDIVTLTSEEGIHENEMNTHSFIALKDSSLLYGTVNGVIAFNPNDIDLSFVREELNLEALYYTNTRTNKEANVTYNNLPKTITLETNYKDSKIKISSRFKNKANNIRYILSDVAPREWQILKEDYLDLSQLKEDNNTLYLSYRIGLNEWSRPRIIEIIKKRPFYLRNSFYATCLAGLILIILLRSLYAQRSTAKRNKEIEQKVEAQTVELSKKIVALSKSNELNEKLFSIIGHDLRSPLVSLNNINKKYRYLIKNGPNEEIEKFGDSIEKNSKNVLNVVDRLLDWSKSLQEGKITLAYHEPNSLINLAYEDIKSQINEKNIDFSINILSKEKVLTEKEGLVIIIRNLIHNAIKFSEYGGQIQVTFEKIKNKYIFSVKDNGKGMSQSEISQFNSNIDVSSSKGTAGEQGLGLGLKICRVLAERFNGSIEVSSNLPKGSIFKVTI